MRYGAVPKKSTSTPQSQNLGSKGKLHALRSISKLGKITYKALGFSGDNVVKTEVIANYLKAEVEAAQGRSDVSLTPQNYKFKFKGTQAWNGHQIYVLHVSPREKKVGLFKGGLWLGRRYLYARAGNWFLREVAILHVEEDAVLNPPSFAGFDGGAGSRWPSTREIESYWYPVWLCYPAGMLPDSKVVDAPPHKISIEQTVEMAKQFELLVLYTSHARLSRRRQDGGDDEGCESQAAGGVCRSAGDDRAGQNSAGQQGDRFRGPPGVRLPDCGLRHERKPLEELPGVSYRKSGRVINNPEGPAIENLDELPWVTKVYKRDLDITRYNVPFLLNPFVSLYTSRGCPALCTFCLWPQTHSGHRWRLRSSDDVANEVRYALEQFPQMKEVFFDDDTFNYRKERTIELCKKLKPLNFTWSCTSRVTTDYDTLKAMKEAGCRLLIVGYESGDPQILKNIKKGATVDMAERFTANCKKLGLVVHGDFIIGLPGETRDSIRKTIDFAKKLDTETIQVSIAHPYPGTEFYDYAKKNDLITIDSMTDDTGHQLPNIIYPGLDRGELVDWVEKFYGEYFFRPRVVWRIVRKAIFNGDERRRLTKEAKEYMALRSKRKKFVAEQKAAKPVAAHSGD